MGMAMEPARRSATVLRSQVPACLHQRLRGTGEALQLWRRQRNGSGPMLRGLDLGWVTTSAFSWLSCSPPEGTGPVQPPTPPRRSAGCSGSGQFLSNVSDLLVACPNTGVTPRPVRLITFYHDTNVSKHYATPGAEAPIAARKWTANFSSAEADIAPGPT